TIQWFFASEAAVDPADAGYVVRRNTRMSVHYEDGIIDELLTPQPSRQLEILHSRFPPGTYSQQSYSHEGEEAGYILSGIFELTIQWFFASEAAVDPADAGYVVRRNTRMSVHYED
ncbi:cupin domain-containing protein, partial [Escherichia coli]